MTRSSCGVRMGVASALVFAATACGSGREALTTPVPFATSAASDAAPVQIVLASTDLAVGRERLAFAMVSPDGETVAHAAATVALFALEGDQPDVARATARATYFPAQLEAAGLYVIWHAFDRAGAWGAEITATLDDGRRILPQRVRFDVAEQPKGVGSGQRPPPTVNRTISTEPDLAKLTSDPSPDPAFYALTVDEAAASGRPTVVVFATPGHCQSRICAPVMDEVKAVRAAVGERANFIHIDVYRQFQPLVLADEMAAWGLTTEPWVYVLGADGRVTARLESSVTAAELLPIVQGALDEAGR